MDKTLAESFSKLSCSLQIGLQSANTQVLRNINRSFDPKTFSKKVAILNNYAIVFGFDLIYGLPEYFTIVLQQHRLCFKSLSKSS